MRVPKSLKRWFKIHLIVDLIFGLPLFFKPRWFLALFGLQAEPFTARILGAAIIGIGASVYYLTTDLEGYKLALKRKILWSSAAIIGILITLLEGESSIGWILLVIFALFLAVWTYYKKQLG